MWRGKRQGDFGHVSLETHTNSGAIYASLWPSCSEEQKTSMEHAARYTQLILSGVKAHFITTWELEKTQGMRDEPDFITRLSGLDTLSINESYHRFKESGAALWSLMGDFASEERLKQNCCSFVLYLLRSGCNHEIMDPLCQELRITAVDIITPQMIHTLAEYLGKHLSHKAEDGFYPVFSYPYRTSEEIETMQCHPLFREWEERRLRKHKYAGVQNSAFFIEPKDNPDPLPRSTALGSYCVIQ